MSPIFPESILRQHTAVLGKTGSGKTSTTKLIVEQLARTDRDARVCIIDPIKSDHWGLTLVGDGKAPGLPFHVLGGPYGHVPLNASAGEAIGKIVASGALRHSIIDMADFDMGEHAKFFTAFAHSLFRHMKGVLYLVVEEAHTFAPKERSGFGEESKATYWMKKLATGSRSKGIRLVVATQRTQELHNAVLGSCETLIVHRVTLPADQKPVMDWLKSNVEKERVDEIAATLSSLKTGEAWVCSGEAKIIERRTFPRISTYDNSATPTGDLGHDVRPAPVDAEALRAIIGNALDEAKANDPAVLKKRIAELEARTASNPAASSAAIDEAVEKLTGAYNERLYNLVHAVKMSLSGMHPALLEQAARVKAAWDELEKAHRFEGHRPAPSSVPQAYTPPTQRPIGKHHPLAGRAFPLSQLDNVDGDDLQTLMNPDGTLRAMSQAFLTCLAQNREGLSKSRLLTLADYRAGGKVSSAFAAMARVGLVEGDGSNLRITSRGLQVLGPYEPLPTGEKLRSQIIARCAPLEAALLREIFNAYPKSIAKGEILRRAGYAAGGKVSSAFAKIVRAGWAVRARAGELCASDDLFAN